MGKNRGNPSVVDTPSEVRLRELHEALRDAKDWTRRLEEAAAKLNAERQNIVDACKVIFQDLVRHASKELGGLEERESRRIIDSLERVQGVVRGHFADALGASSPDEMAEVIVSSLRRVVTEEVNKYTATVVEYAVREQLKAQRQQGQGGGRRGHGPHVFMDQDMLDKVARQAATLALDKVRTAVEGQATRVSELVKQAKPGANVTILLSQTEKDLPLSLPACYRGWVPAAHGRDHHAPFGRGAACVAGSLDSHP